VAGETIVIAEDDPGSRALLSQFLESSGYRVATAANGVEALRAIRRSTPNMVITDLGMPEMNGAELARRLRAHPRTARLPIVMLSASTEDADILAGYEGGADEYISKPVQLAILRVKIDALLKRAAAAAKDAPPLPQRGIVVLFLHGKGGVGATTVTVNLASVLSGTTAGSVTVLDLNLEFGNAPMYLNVRPDISLAEAVGRLGGRELDGEVLDRLLAEHPSGVRVLAGSSAPEQAELVSGQMVQSTLQLLRQRSDFVLVDTDASFSERNLGLIDNADVICHVTAPILPSLKATLDSTAVLERIGIPRERQLVVLNSMTPYGVTAEQAGRFFNRALDIVIPYSEQFDQAANSGRPVALADGHTKAMLPYRRLADRIITFML
jgi:DNA-binding response OmpR family regulator